MLVNELPDKELINNDRQREGEGRKGSGVGRNTERHGVVMQVHRRANPNGQT